MYICIYIYPLLINEYIEIYVSYTSIDVWLSLSIYTYLCIRIYIYIYMKPVSALQALISMAFLATLAPRATPGTQHMAFDKGSSGCKWTEPALPNQPLDVSYLEGKVAQIKRLLYPKVAQHQKKVAANHRPRACQVIPHRGGH